MSDVAIAIFFEIAIIFGSMIGFNLRLLKKTVDCHCTHLVTGFVFSVAGIGIWEF
ncbi:MAG: hypothetical protein ACLTKI_06170 [Lachnospiraceae bacterium]